MSKFILALLFISSPVFADEWTSADTKREVAYFIVDAVDWAQTRNIARSPDCQVGKSNQVPNCIYEKVNPILGDCPSVDRVDAYFAIAALAHVALSYNLPKDWRHGFQYVSIGFEIGMVQRNRSLGISARF